MTPPRPQTGNTKPGNAQPTHTPPTQSRDVRARLHQIQRATRAALHDPAAPKPQRPARLLVGISGGPDSSALLLALADGVDREGWSLVAAHVDHGIAPAPIRQAFQAAAADVAQRAGVALHVRRVDAPAEAARAGDGLEAAARRLRYQALLDIATSDAVRESSPIDALVVGHTMDDQAESVLLHLVRGSALDGLAGMSARCPIPRDTGPRDPAISDRHSGPGAHLPLIRPLLGLRRHETAALCRAFGLSPLADPANTNPAHTRVRIRTDILPRLADLNPAIVERLASLAGAVALDRALLTDLTTEALRDVAQMPPRDGPRPHPTHAEAPQRDSAPPAVIQFSRRALRRQPPAIRARVLRRRIQDLGGEPPDWERTAALLRLVDRGGHRVQCAGGVQAEAIGDRLCLRRNVPR